jgi:sulfur carrier protein
LKIRAIYSRRNLRLFPGNIPMALVNGTEYKIQEEITIKQLLEELQITSKRIAVEVNMQIVPKAHFEKHQLKPDDVIEIVAFVGGG